MYPLMPVTLMLWNGAWSRMNGVGNDKFDPNGSLTSRGFGLGNKMVHISAKNSMPFVNTSA